MLKVCKQCKKEFNAKTSRARLPRVKFCSQRCNGDSRIENLTGKKFGKLTGIKYSRSIKRHSYWIFRCDCGKIKEIRLDDVKNGRIKSCKCSHKDRIPWNKNKKGYKSPYRMTGVTKNCLSCGKEIYCINAKKERKKFCSKECMKFWLKGERSPGWQGGKSFELYGIDWTLELKEKIRQRDNYICRVCGIYQNQLDRKLDVHHIDYLKENLNSKNLISLCKPCHMKTNFNRENWERYFKDKIKENLTILDTRISLSL